MTYSSRLNRNSMAMATYRPCSDALTTPRSAKLRTTTGTELMTMPYLSAVHPLL